MNVALRAEAESFRAEVPAFLRRALPDDWRGLGALDGEQARAFTENVADDAGGRGLPDAELAAWSTAAPGCPGSSR